MEKSENESDSSGDYMDATDDPLSYSEEPESLAAASLDTEIQKIRKNKVENALSNVTIPEINKFLVERMNPDFGILDKLLASKALSRAEIAEVGRLSTFYEQNTRLLELVTKNEKLTELFNALKDTHQEHLVNYVTAKGEYNEDYGGAWPLTERETSILDVNQEALVNLLDFTGNEIVRKLYGLNVLNQRQTEFICKQPYDYKKAGVLLDFLFRSSMSDYWKMITCLRGTNQLPAAKILFDGGAVVRVHNAVTGDTEAVTTAEKDIVERIDSMLSNMDLEVSSRVLERLQLKLFAARAGHSVNLYILCETMDELMHLSNLLTSGELQRGIERFFNELISRSETVHVFSTVSQETLDKCKMFLEVDRSQEKVFSKDILKLCEQMKVEEECKTEEEQEEQPIEVTYDVFLVNLERHRVFVEGRMDPNHGLVDRLQESGVIDYNQVQIICAEKVSFKKSRKILLIILEGNSSEKITKFCEAMRDTKQQHLLNYVEANGVYKTQFVGDWPLSEREINIIDENQSYLKQNMDTAGGLLADMLKHNAITQCQAERVSEHTSRLDRNTALLDIIRRGSLSEYKNTIDILVETKQEHIAKILILASKVVQTHSSATGEVPIIKQTKAELATQLLKVIPKETRARLQELLQQNNSGLIDDPLSELMTLVGPFLSDGTVGKRRSSEDRREMESTHPERPEVLLGVVEGGEQDIPGIGTGTAQPAQGISPDPDERSDKENMENQRDVLIERMESEFGLLDKLRKCLTVMEIADVKSKTTTFEKNKKLLELIFKNNKHQDLIRALAETRQTHLVNWVRANGEYRVEFVLDWPLKQKEIEILEDNQEAWTDLVDPRELLILLFRKNVINKRQMDFIQGKPTEYEKNEELLYMLRRCSLTAFFITIECLRASNQDHIAAMLEGSGAVVQVHANLDADKLDETETQIVKDLTSLLLQTTENRSSLLLQELQTRIIAARRGN